MLKRKAGALVAVLLLVVGFLEVASRVWLGLGDPPISIPDTEIDYIFAPNQNCSRFGNKILYNNLSMRCGFPISERETTNRVFVVGDSVVNGGVLTDHADLATTLLQDAFPQAQICNVSAGSWGPGNYTAYFRKHLNLIGSNDVLFVEVNSHDLWEDNPARTAGANVGRDVSLPDRKPLFAFSEGFSRYFIPQVRRRLGLAAINTKVDVAKWDSDAENEAANWNLRELAWLFSRQFRGKALIIHRSRDESRRSNEQSIGEIRFVKWAKESNVRCVLLELDPEIHYRDGIHLNETGQYKLFELLKKELCSQLCQQEM